MAPHGAGTEDEGNRTAPGSLGMNVFVPHAVPGASAPRHIAIIMDGNGRWAMRRGLPRTAGHRQGVEAVRRTVQAALDLDIPYLTLFGFSSENWKRPRAEVEALMGLLRLYLRREVEKLRRDGVRIRFIGDRTAMPAEIVALMNEGEARTAGNDRLVLTIALNYSGRHEIAATARRLAAEVAAGRLTVDDIDDAAFSAYHFSADVPDPDLLIRTSGEQRVSNFLLWQIAYSELVFVDRMWPDFQKQDLEAAVADYQRRERRYGGVNACR